MADLRKLAPGQSEPDPWKVPSEPAPTPWSVPERDWKALPGAQEDEFSRIDRLARRLENEQTEVDRSFLGEIGASVGRGALGLAKLPVQLAKIVGADILGSETVKNITEPIIGGLEDIAESPTWKPSKEAGGKSIDLDRIISNPGEVLGQITSQITNPRFWASQLPEGAMSMIPAIVGAWAPRAVAYAGKLGTAMKAAKAAGDTAKVAEIGARINRLSTIGMYGMSMAMEAAQAEEKVREFELRNPDKPIPWGNRVLSILGTGVVAGGLEALSFGRVFMGKYGGEISVPEMAKQILNGKGGGLLVRKILDSVATEGVTEGAQSLVENAFAKMGFDPDQKLTEGIVESVLIGAALGGVGGGIAGITTRKQAMREVATRIQETKRLSEEEYRQTLQAVEEGALRGGAYAGMPGIQESPILQREMGHLGKPGLADMPSQEPEGPAPGAAPAPEPPPVTPPSPMSPTADEALHGSLLKDYPLESAAPLSQAEPLSLGSKPQAAAPATMAEQITALVKRVDETGDPGAARELNQLILANREDVSKLFQVPEREGLRPIAERLDSLIRRVEETGDPNAAKELHQLLADHQDVLQGVGRGEITRAAGPITPTGAYPEEVAAPAPKPPPEAPAPPAPEAPPEAPPGAPGGAPALAPEATPIAEAPPAPGPAPQPLSVGRETVATTARGNQVPLRFAVVEGEGLVTSHDDSLSQNPNYPQELQPRDRTRAASELQVSKIANTLRPELLADNPLASDGAPIVGQDMVVESGNARTIAIKRVYAGQTGQGNWYRQWLLDHAGEFGLDPAAIQQAQAPVLVRVRTMAATPQERAQLAREFNERSTAPMSPVEQAQSDAQAMLAEHILDAFAPNDDGEILKPANNTFIRAFMTKVVGDPEMYSYYDASGRINQAGLLRIRNAIFAAAYGNTAALEKLAESTSDAARNITTALTMVAPRMAVVQRKVQGGHLHPLDLNGHVAAAAEILQSLREQGIGIEEYLGQGKMFEEVPALVADLLKFFGDYGRSRKKITATLNAYLDIVEAAGNPKQGALIDSGIAIPTRGEVLQAAIKRMEAAYGTGTAVSPDLQQGEAGGSPTVGEPGPEAPPEGPAGAGGIPGLTTPKPKPKAPSPVEQKLALVKEQFADVDEAKARRVLRALPDAAPSEVAMLAQDDELFNQVAKGNLSAQEREHLYRKYREAQGNLPGMGAGGLFDQEPTPAATTKPGPGLTPPPIKAGPPLPPPDSEAIYTDILKSAADTPEELRPSDVFRVMDEADDRGVKREFEKWILEQKLSSGTWEALHKYKAEVIWEGMDKNRRAGVRHGLFPQEVMQETETAGYDNQKIVVALMKVAKDTPAVKSSSPVASEKVEPPDSFNVGDRVSWTERGKELTGTIESGPNKDGEVDIAVDQVNAAGGVTIGRISLGVKVESLTKGKASVPAVTTPKELTQVEIANERIAKLDQEIEDLKEKRRDLAATPEMQAQDPRNAYKVGDKVWTMIPNIMGMPSKIKGEVYRAKMKMRVRITTQGVGGAQSTDLFDYKWTREGEEFRIPAPIADLTKRIEQLAKQRREIFDALPDMARDDAFRSWEKAIRGGKEKVRIGEVVVGDKIRNHFNNEVLTVHKVETDDNGRVFIYSNTGLDEDGMFKQTDVIHGKPVGLAEYYTFEGKTTVEATKPAATAAGPKFEIGDIVKAKSDAGIAGIEGKKVKVVHIKTDADGNQRIKVEGNNLYWKPSDFDAVPPAPLPPGIAPKTPEPTPEVAPENDTATKQEVTAAVKVAQKVKERLDSESTVGMVFADLAEWGKEAFGGTMAEGKFTPKDVYDAMELGVNLHIQANPELYDPHAANPAEVVKNLEELIKRLPTQTRRTGEMLEFQQFSTPPPLAYVVGWVANIGPNDAALEPSAGIGGIAVFAANAGAREVVVNELSPRRATLLREFQGQNKLRGVFMGFDEVFTENAEQLNNILPERVKPTVVLMNPPFSATAGRTSKRDTMVGAAHIEQALKRLEPGGRLVAIVGRGMAFGKPAFSEWWRKVRKEYNVLANIGVDGKNYSKYGTSFDVQILVIDKTGPTTKPPVIGMVQKVADLIEKLGGVKDARTSAGKRTPDQSGGQGGPKKGGGQGPQPVGPVSPATPPDVSGPGVGEPTPPSGVPTGRPAGVPGEPVGDTAAPGDGGVRPPVERGGGGRGGGVQPVVTGPATESGQGTVGPDERIRDSEKTARVETKAAEVAKGDFTDSVYEDYRPARLKIPGAQPHPAALKESAAMASVPAPPPTYTPNLPERVIMNGHLSEAQMEAVVYAGQSHSEILPSGQRRGFAIGDGTGVGKGREVSAIFWDNWSRGRKKGVWLSEKGVLNKDAKRDIEGVTWDSKMIRTLPKASESIKDREGIMFLSYDTLKGGEKAKNVKGRSPKSRVDQLVDWLGEDFDGVIAFDEAHNINNSDDDHAGGLRGRKPAQKAQAAVELQRRLPNARVVYVSATMAEEPRHLAFADRLGLWGPGTAFSNKDKFLSEIESGGVAAMEVIARDLKAMGRYIARGLSFDKVKYERLTHKITPEQTTVYNELAQAWQVVLANLSEALELTGASGDRKAQMSAKAMFWSYNQRFFNQIVTSFQMPSLLKTMQADLDAGYSPILQLVNTYGAAEERAHAQKTEDMELDELDFSPKQMLIQYLERSFPTQQFEEYEDEDGNTKMRPVVDSKGDPVENREAVALRERIITRLGMLRFPESPLNQLINTFGPDNVAEVTGRKQRLVKVGGEVKQEKRGDAAVARDIQDFRDDKKRILVFSSKGDTGASYHADLGYVNQRLRRHYLVQPGWQAKKAVQGFGRTHRTNQKQDPEFILVETDIKGQKRFIAAIARRLDQLGALTKGQRQTGSSGLLKAEDNLETEHAQKAIVKFVDDLLAGQVADLEFQEYEKRTGLKLRYVGNDGSIRINYPNIRQFMNRLLSLEIDYQNKTFEAFDQRHKDILQREADRGRLDVGMETIRPERGGRIEKVKEETVYVHPESGAETKVVSLNLINPTKPRAWADVDKADSNFYINKQSGKIWAITTRNPHSSTDQKTGRITHEYLAVGPNSISRRWVDGSQLKDNWTKIPPAAAQGKWSEEIANLSKETSSEIHLVTGLILPIWDRLGGDTNIRRMQDVDGNRYLGRVIPRSLVKQTLAKLGATPEVKAVEVKNAGDIYRKVLNNNWVVELANGWQFKKALVSGEYRIELAGAEPEYLDEFKKLGLIVEMIQFRTRVFVPVAKSGEVHDLDIINSLIKNRPIVSAQPRFSSEGSRYKVMGLRSNIGGPLTLKPETQERARQWIAKEYKVSPDKLKYDGVMDGGKYGALAMFTVDDPGHPRHQSTLSYAISFKGAASRAIYGPAAEGGPVTLKAVQKTFGPAVVVKEVEGGFNLLLPGGKVLAILTGQNITASREEILRTYGREQTATEQVMGEWRPMSVGGVIFLAKEAGMMTLDHEVFHAACDLVLTKKELEAVLRKHGDWETAARAYENWNTQEPATIFQKILNFFKRLSQLLRPTAEGVFAKIKNGEVWLRTEAGPGTVLQSRFALRPADAESRLQTYQGKMMAPEAKGSRWQNFKDTVLVRGDARQEAADTLHSWYDEIVDRNAPFERAQARAMKAGGLIPTGEAPTYTLGYWRGQEGWTAQAVMKNGVYHETMEDGRFVGDSRKVGESLNKRLDPLRTLAAKRNEKPETVANDLFNRFMVAQRDLELAGETGVRGAGEIKGVNPEESKAALEAMKEIYGDDYAILEKVAGRLEDNGDFTLGSIREWADQAILQRLVQAGLISPTLYREIKKKNQYYLPFKRLMDEVNDYIDAYGRALGVKGRVIHQIRGSERLIQDPIQMLLDLAAKANYAYARNRVLDSVAKLGRFDPEIHEVKAKLVPTGAQKEEGKKAWAWSQTPPEEGCVPYYRDGKVRWLKLPPDMFKATQNMMPEDLGLLLRWAKKPADLLRAGAVTTPEFGLVTNVLRDIVQAWLFSRFGFSPLKWFRDLGLLLTKDPKTLELRHQAEAGGGFMATLAQSMLDPEKITADDIAGKRKGMWYAAHPIQAMRHVSAYLENMTRFSIYKQARGKGLSHAEAIHEMRRTTLDFRRTGAHPVVRYLNMIIPFFNASIQGSDKLLSELAGPNKFAVMRRLSLMVAGTIGLWMLAHNDDRYKELENWERNYFWHIPLGGKDAPMIRIPKPFEAGILFGSVPERILDQLVDKNVGGVKSALGAAWKALTPEFIPAFARGIIEGQTNYNWFLDRPIEDVALANLPVELRSKPWTTELAKAVSKYVGPVANPVMELSPVKVEHLIRTMSGGLGANYFMPGIDVALRKAGVLEDIPQPAQDTLQRLWGLRALFTKPPTGYRAKTVNDFMENYQTILRADQGWKVLWNSGQMEQLDKFLADNPEAMFARVARQTMEEMGKIRKERTRIYESKALTSEQKKIKLDALDERILNLAKQGQAFMDPEVAQALKMPSRFKTEMGVKKAMDLDSYYKLVVESVGDAYTDLRKESRLPHLEEEQRQAVLIRTLRQAREEYQPILKKPEDVMKPFRFGNLWDKPTRKEKVQYQVLFGATKINPGVATGFRMKEEVGP